MRCSSLPISYLHLLCPVRICPSTHATDSTAPDDFYDTCADQYSQSSCIHGIKSKNCAHKHIIAPGRCCTLGPPAPCGANRCAWSKDHAELHLALPSQPKGAGHLVGAQIAPVCRALLPEHTVLLVQAARARLCILHKQPLFATAPWATWSGCIGSLHRVWRPHVARHRGRGCGGLGGHRSSHLLARWRRPGARVYQPQ